MSTQILDGKGRGFLQGVDSSNRTLTNAVAKTLSQDRAAAAAEYAMGMDNMTLTTAGESAIFYIKNDDTTRRIQTLTLAIFLGSSNVSGSVLARVYQNPTGGTVITAGTALTPSNINFGSQVPAVGTFRRGGEGFTVSGGTKQGDLALPQGQPSVFAFDSVLPTGASGILSLQPPAGNTSLLVTVLLSFAYIVED